MPIDANTVAAIAAIASAIAAVASIVVAAKHLGATKKERKIALFDKRLNILEQIDHLVLGCLAGTWNYIDETTYREHQNWIQVRKEARWLFDEELNNWMNENISMHFAAYMDLRQQQKETEDPIQRKQLAQQWNNDRRKLSEAHDQLVAKFAPYLRVYK